jgi:hypothetical protein
MHLTAPQLLNTPMVFAARRARDALADLELGYPVTGNALTGVSAGAFLASYTWSKAMDNADGDNQDVQDLYNPRLTYGRESFDRTHNVELSGIYTLPVGPGRDVFPLIIFSTASLWAGGSLRVSSSLLPASLSRYISLEEKTQWAVTKIWKHSQGPKCRKSLDSADGIFFTVQFRLPEEGCSLRMRSSRK